MGRKGGRGDIRFFTLCPMLLTFPGHLKRFMRGIAELLEISPATPVAADVPIVQNGKDQADFEAELTKALPSSDLLPPPPPPPASYAQMEENGLKNAVSNESIEAPPPKPKPKPSSRSPSHSPQTQRRGVPQGLGVGGGPPPPRRAPQTTLSAAQQADSLTAQNRHSFSSSTSSLSSNYSERITGSVELGAGLQAPPTGEIPLATQQMAAVSESPPRIPGKTKKPTISQRTTARE